MVKPSIVMLCSDSASSRIICHALAPDVELKAIVVESAPSPWAILRRRLKKLGLLPVLGQVQFLALNLILAWVARKRIDELKNRYRLNDAPFPQAGTRKVANVNNEEVIELIRNLCPDAVVVHGTRILSPELLACIEKPFINTHVGITPRYRGIHGGYWALANDDAKNYGVTVHLVDKGIDTGGVLYQSSIHIEKRDSFNTYPIHQVAAALPLLLRALRDVRDGTMKITEGVGPSRLWHHPTLWSYLRTWISKCVR